MSDQQPAQPLIKVEEVHTYDVDLGRQANIAWNESESSLTLSAIIPYSDDRVTYDHQSLADMPSPAGRLHLGDIVLQQPKTGNRIESVAIHLPAGSNLAEHVLSSTLSIE